MDPSRAAEIKAASRRLVHTAGDLLDRARSAVQGSRDLLESGRLSQQAWEEWATLRPALRQLPPSRRILVVCSFCHRARKPDGEWTSIPTRILRLMEGGPDALWLSHGICPPCLQQHYGDLLDEADPAD